MRTRILIGTLALTMAAIAALFVPAAVALAAAEREAQVVELQREATDAAARAGASDGPTAPDVSQGDPDDQIGGETTTPDADHRFATYDTGGTRVDGDGPAQLEPALGAALEGTTSEADVGEERVVAVPLAGGGALRAAEPRSEADDAARAAIARLALSAVLVLAAAAVAAWLLARSLTGPLGQLRRAAARLGGGDFTATAPTTGVAEIDEVGLALNTSAGRIGTLVERERQLTADTTHQLRTPITGLRLALEGELAAPRPDPTEVLHEALGAVDKLEATVTSITDLARDAGPTDPIDVDAVVRAALAHWEPLFARAHRTVAATTTGRVLSAARRAAVETILDVLLDNALRHGRGAVHLVGEVAGGTARVTVTDEGTCTLDDAHLFARHESSGGGTGIGLHLARTLAAGEGARLRLLSPEPTTFLLQLPLAPAPGGGAGHGPGGPRSD